MLSTAAKLGLIEGWSRRPAPDRGDQLRPPQAGPADGRRRGGRGGAAAAARCPGSAWCSTSAAWTGRSRPGWTRSTSWWSPAKRSAPATRECRHRRDRRLAPTRPRARAAGLRTTVTIAAAFGCPFEGEVRRSRPRTICRAASGGPDELALADTIGVGVPAQVRRLAGVGGPAAPGSRCAGTSTTPATPATPTRSPRPSWGAGRAGQQRRRHRRLPVRPGRHRQHRHRGPAVPAAPLRRPNRRRPGALLPGAARTWRRVRPPGPRPARPGRLVSGPTGPCSRSGSELARGAAGGAVCCNLRGFRERLQ